MYLFEKYINFILYLSEIIFDKRQPFSDKKCILIDKIWL